MAPLPAIALRRQPWGENCGRTSCEPTSTCKGQTAQNRELPAFPGVQAVIVFRFGQWLDSQASLLKLRFSRSISS